MTDGPRARRIVRVENDGPLDGKILAELRDLQSAVSPTFLQELIDLFIRQVDSLLPLLKEASGKRDLDTIVRISHTLKGTCGSVAAVRLTNLFSNLNQTARRGEWQSVQEQIGAIEAEYALARAALEAEKGR